MSRLLRLLLLLALALMPVGLVAGGRSASAASAPATHCADMREMPAGPAHHPGGRAADCALACSALPSLGAALIPPEPGPATLDPIPLATGQGLAPEAATPPPRFS